ncbi:MAG: FtsX-like permease family protein [Bryobacteraceae bacterium]
MKTLSLAMAGLKHYWRPNLAVVAGVATAVAVLAGAMIVGESMRASLRRLALERLGNTDSIIQSNTLFREKLASSVPNSAPIIVLEGIVTHQSSGRRAGRVALYGVDDRFWIFQGRKSAELTGRDAALSPALASELGASPGDTLLVRLEKPADIPAESLFGRKEDAAPTIRLSLKQVLPASQSGEFSLRPTQGSVRAVFVPLGRLQREIGAAGRANVLLIGRTAASAEQLLRAAFAIEDLGIKTRTVARGQAVQLESSAGVLRDSLVASAQEAAKAAGFRVLPVLTYMATRIRVREHEVPYALVAATDLAAIGFPGTPPGVLLLNSWVSFDLEAHWGDPVTMEYLVWHDDGRLTEEKAQFTNGGRVAIENLAADRDLVPEYPGITDAADVSKWNPPFAMDLSRIRPRDEEYWDLLKTTPKAWLQLERGQQLWKSRWGKLTALRLMPEKPATKEELEEMHQDFRDRLRAQLEPTREGMQAIWLRQQNVTASRGATDFGEYFSYFSFFLVVSALLLAGLFFRLGLEQRFSEIGLLRAVGFTPAHIRKLFLWEGALLAVIGAALGAAGAVGYAAAILKGLVTWWRDAIGTRALALELSTAPLFSGALGGMAAAMFTILVTLRGIRDASPRRLLSGGASALAPRFATRASVWAFALCITGLALLGASAAAKIPPAAGFFGAGALLLAAALAVFRSMLGASVRRPVSVGLGQLAFRNAASRPGRTVLSAALIASATFLIVSVEAFRRDPDQSSLDPKSGTGGYPLIAESVRPVYHNLNTKEGREAMGVQVPDAVRFESLRLRPGDDASCLNLYQPQNPRVLGVPPSLVRQGRFAFAGSEGQDANPWLLLDRDRDDGAIPAIADANSMQYVLHKSIGEEIVLPDGTRLRLVASLSDSIFQSELLIAERHFIRVFPREQGYRVFLIDAPPAQVEPATTALESALSDHGFDAMPAPAKLAAFHRVENTYLSTFQTLGGLGLVLGTIGLAAVLFRNILERKRELALLSAVGYSRQHLSRLVLRENLMIFAAGLGIGVAAAMLAIAPALAGRSNHFPFASMALLLMAVLATGVLATLVATWIALRQSLTSALRAG